MEKQNKKLKQQKNQLRIKKKWKKSNIKISKELRDIIHGYLMSDGFIRNGVLTIDQSKKQKAFVFWLYNKFEPVRTSSPIKEVIRIHPKTKTKTSSLRFFTRAFLSGFRQIWYKKFIDSNGVVKYKKQLPKNIHCFFNETFISLWYAGDGTKIIGSVGAKFEVTNLTVQERLKLKNLFYTKFGIKTEIISSGISSKGTKQWALKISAKQYTKFRNLITKSDFISNIFPYKLHKKI